MADDPIRSNLPEGEYLRRVGLVAYLVSAVEGLLLFDLPRFGSALPPEISVDQLVGKTTGSMGRYLKKHGPNCTDQNIADYLAAGADALIEIADLRNSVLHARPATDADGRSRLYRWYPSEMFFIDDDRLDSFARRIDELHLALHDLRPPMPGART